MFTRDETFKHTGFLHETDPAKKIKRTAEILQIFTQTLDVSRGGRPVSMNFSAEKWDDSHWRVKVIPDWLPRQHFSGIGNPLDEFVVFQELFLEFFATPKDARVTPWEEVQ